jgi:hypothetical protein
VAEQETPRAPVTVHPVLAWPAIGALAVFIAGCLFWFAETGLSPWWLAALFPVLGPAGSAAAAAKWPEEVYGFRQPQVARRLAWAAAGAATVWLIWCGHVGPMQSWAGLALVLGPLWLWFAILSVRAPRQAEVAAVRFEQGRQLVQDRSWRVILDKAGCDDVVITKNTEHRGGLVITVEPSPDAEKPPTYSEFAARSARIATHAALHYRRTGSPLPRNAIRPEEGSDDAEFLLNVTMRDVFEQASVYVPDYTPGDITRLCDLGEYEDASRILLSIVGIHWKIVGATGSGKSVVTNNLIARITACSNALVWVGATDKLIPLVWPWLKCWFEGRAIDPVLDWVAGKDVRLVLRMLRAAYKLACDRNDRLADVSKLAPTVAEPAVFVILEEVSHSTEFSETIVTHDGQTVTVSDLIKLIGQAGRSGCVQLVLLSQYGTNPGLGDRASEIMRNITGRICLRTTESHDGYRTLPGLPASVDTTVIPLYTMYVQPSIDVARAVPGKAPELDGTAQVDPVAARQAAWRPPGIEAATDLGADYALRWDRGRCRELSLAVERAGLRWPAAAGGPPADPPPGDPAGPDDDGDDVDDVDTTWTDDDDAEVAQMLGGGDDPGTGTGTGTRAKAFDLPDAEAGAERLRRIAAGQDPDTGEEYTAAARHPDESGAVQDAQPVPAPLDAVVAYLVAEQVQPDGWVLSDVLAQGIGYGSGHRLGIALSALGLRSKNLPREYDPRQRKGYTARDLFERAQVYRFGAQ